VTLYRFNWYPVIAEVDGTAFQVNVGVVGVTTDADLLSIPGPITVGTGSVVGVGAGVGAGAAGVWKYRYALSGPVVDPTTTRRFHTNESPAAKAVGTVKLVALAPIWKLTNALAVMS